MDWIFLVPILIFSVVLHEVSHGTMANYLGDPTAKNAGRLTLNPLYHLDLFGSIIVPLFLILARVGIIFGWAKPVPINPYNFRDQKYGEAKVAIAGPLANLSLVLVFGLLLRFLLIPTGFTVDLISPPFTFGDAIAYIVFINIILAIFNLLPVPPLDGSHILFAFLPRRMGNLKIFFHRFGGFVLLFIIFFLFNWIVLITNSIFQLIVGFPLL